MCYLIRTHFHCPNCGAERLYRTIPQRCADMCIDWKRPPLVHKNKTDARICKTCFKLRYPNRADPAEKDSLASTSVKPSGPVNILRIPSQPSTAGNELAASDSSSKRLSRLRTLPRLFTSFAEGKIFTPQSSDLPFVVSPQCEKEFVDVESSRPHESIRFGDFVQQRALEDACIDKVKELEVHLGDLEKQNQLYAALQETIHFQRKQIEDKMVSLQSLHSKLITEDWEGAIKELEASTENERMKQEQTEKAPLLSTVNTVQSRKITYINGKNFDVPESLWDDLHRCTIDPTIDYVEFCTNLTVVNRVRMG